MVTTRLLVAVVTTRCCGDSVRVLHTERLPIIIATSRRIIDEILRRGCFPEFVDDVGNSGGSVSEAITFIQQRRVPEKRSFF